MVVHQAGGLHEGVADGRPDEVEAQALHLLAHGVGLRRRDRHGLQVAPAVSLGLAADEGPEEVAQGAVLLLHLQREPRVPRHALDLRAILHDAVRSVAGAPQELGHVAGPELGHLGQVEALEGAAVGLALLEDGVPAEAGLRALQAQELEELGVLAPASLRLDGEAPLPRPCSTFAKLCIMAVCYDD